MMLMGCLTMLQGGTGERAALPQQQLYQNTPDLVAAALLQGDDVMHDAIRQQQLDWRTPDLVAAALELHGSSQEEVLWAALFSLAVLVKEGSRPFQPATRALLKAGMLQLLEGALLEYKVCTQLSPHLLHNLGACPLPASEPPCCVLKQRTLP